MKAFGLSAAFFAIGTLLAWWTMQAVGAPDWAFVVAGMPVGFGTVLLFGHLQP